MNLKQLDDFHKTRTGYLVFAVIELALSAWFFSLAVNSGSLWQWGLTVILLIGCLQNLGRLMSTFTHGKRKASKA
jgi:hypothetical protein